jgi:hypothetical protein
MQERFKNIASNKYTPIIMLFLCSFTIVFGAYSPYFSNDLLFASGGDGLKHYYSLSYFIKYGHGWDFNGIAYPYGEHFMFMDGHGIVGKMMNLFSNYVFDISHYAVGIIHFWLLSWLIISPFFLYKILRYFEFKAFEAVLVAILIFSLSPQWHRIFGHQSLSYVVFIPMLWYFLIQISIGKKRWFWGVCYGFSALFFGWIHPYYMPLAAIFALSYMLTSGYSNGKFDFPKIRTLVLAAFIPMIIFQIFMTTTDPFPGERGYVAGGFFQYMATFEGVFLPNFGKYFRFWQLLTGVKMQNGEAFNYIGFSGQIVLVVLVFNFLKKLVKRQFLVLFKFSDNTNLNQFVQAAFIVLLFSFALIFQWFPQLLEGIPPLRQFRSLGRFAWIFYYVFTVFTAYQIKNWLQKYSLKNRSFAIGLAVILCGIWGIEGYQNIQFIRVKIIKKQTPNYFTQQEFTEKLKSIHKEPSDFQSIIPVPSIHVGSDKLAIFKSDKSLSYALLGSYEMNLPVAAYYSARVPLAKSFEVLRWFSDDLTRRESEFKLYNDKPFLIISSNKKLDKADKDLLAKAKLIYESKAYNLYELDIKAYKKGFQKKQEYVLKTYFERRDSLYKINDSTFTDKQTKAIYFNAFPNTSNIWKQEQPFGTQNYFGRANQHVLFDGKLPFDTIGQQLELSVWVYSNEDLPSMPILKCEVFNENDVLIEKSELLGMHSTTTFGRWVRISMTIRANEHRNRIYLGYYNNFRIFNCWADNFLIRPVSVNVWNATTEKVPYYNGYILK